MIYEKKLGYLDFRALNTIKRAKNMWFLFLLSMKVRESLEN